MIIELLSKNQLRGFRREACCADQRSPARSIAAGGRQTVTKSIALHVLQAISCSAVSLVLGGCVTRPALAAGVPEQYFRLMEAELPLIEKRLVRDSAADPDVLAAQGRILPGAVMAAAVLYAQPHPTNHARGDSRKLDLALALGDLLATESEQGRYQKILNSYWGTYMWLEAYRLLLPKLGAERQKRWDAALRRDVQRVFDQMAPRADFPRYQSPYIRTSTNHFSLWASTVYLAGRVFQQAEWERIASRILHRLATAEQTTDGYWGELTDNGPATGYNALTASGIALYWEHSGDAAALEALRRATSFQIDFTWPDGSPVETINGRNRHWAVSPWAHFAFSNFPDGRSYAKFLTGFFKDGALEESGRGVAQNLGRIAQNALYYHEGPSTTIPQQRPAYARQMKVAAGIRKTGPWTSCLSGLIDPPVANQFMLDRQGHVSIFHEKCGLIITGGNSKHQAELATLLERTSAGTRYLPLSSELMMSAQRDRLALAYETFFCELVVPAPSSAKMPFQFRIIEANPERREMLTLTLQLCLQIGKVLETARCRRVVGPSHFELGPEEIGGVIRHAGWTLKVDPSARLVWPVYPFNPYSNGPETELRYAVGALAAPIKLTQPAEGALPWRRQELAFELAVNQD
jgi:hypothetical protein